MLMPKKSIIERWKAKHGEHVVILLAGHLRRDIKVFRNGGHRMTKLKMPFDQISFKRG